MQRKQNKFDINQSYHRGLFEKGMFGHRSPSSLVYTNQCPKSAW